MQLVAARPGGAATIVLLILGLPVMAWLSVHRRRIDAAERLTTKALEGSSPTERARILRAGGEFGSKLHPGTPPGVTPRRTSGIVGRPGASSPFEHKT